jgi:RHS repeat-associated protein
VSVHNAGKSDPRYVYTAVGAGGGNAAGGLAVRHVRTTDGLGNTSTTGYVNATSFFADAATNGNGQTLSALLEAFGRLTQVTSPRTVDLDGIATNLGTKYTYESAFPHRLLSVQTGAIQQSDGSFYPGGGNTKGATRFAYYGAGDPSGSPAGLLKSVTSPRPGTVGGAETVETVYQYTSLGSVRSISLPPPDPSGTPAVYQYEYTISEADYVRASEVLGEPVRIIDPNGHAVRIRYDDYDSGAGAPNRGNIVAIIDADGHQTDFEYNAPGQLTRVLYPATGQTGPGRGVTEYVYPFEGGPLASIRTYAEDGTLFREVKHGRGREVETTFGQTHDGVKAVQLKYDGAYSIAQVGDGKSQFSTFTPDVAGRTIGVTFPTNSTGGSGQDQLGFAYTKAGVLQERTNGRGQVTAYTIATAVEEDSRLNGVQYDDTLYPGKNIALTYDVFNRVIGRTDAAGSETYSYDDLDNVTSVTTTYGAIPGSGVAVAPPAQRLDYAYFPDGSRQNLSVTSGGTLFGAFGYTYDKGGRLTEMTAPWQHGKYVYEYYDNGWLKRGHVKFTSGVYNGTDLAVTLYNYNGRGQLTGLANTAEDPFDSYPLTSRPYLFSYDTFTYDAAGNRTGMRVATDRMQHAPQADERVAYTYDAQDRLTGETRPASISDQYAYSYSAAFDDAGNLTALRGIAASYNENNQNTAYTFDGDGSPTAYRNASTLAYDEEARLSQIGSGSFPPYRALYRGDGLRAWRLVSGGAFGGTYFLYDGSVLLLELEYNSSAGAYAIKNLYGFGASGLVQRFDTRFGTGGDATTYLFDPLGSVVTRVDETGKPLCVSAYDAFGFVQTDKNPNTSDLNRYSYPKSAAYSIGFGAQWGYYSENGTDLTPADGDDRQRGDRGLILCTHRYFDPVTGRWLTRDPIGYQGAINLYEYVGGNPVMMADPDGEDGFVIAGGISVNDPNAHDRWALNFLQAAALKVAQLQKAGIGPITLVMYTSSYERRAKFEHKNKNYYVNLMRSKAKKYGYKLVTIASSAEFTSLLNSLRPGSVNEVDYYGHSNAASMFFEYSSVKPTYSTDFWGAEDAQNVNTAIFAPGASWRSYGCNQGDDGGLMDQLNSMWNIKTVGSMGKTNFEPVGRGILPPSSAQGYRTFSRFRFKFLGKRIY